MSKSGVVNFNAYQVLNNLNNSISIATFNSYYRKICFKLEKKAKEE